MFFAALLFAAGIAAEQAAAIPAWQWLILVAGTASGAICVFVRQRAWAVLLALAAFVPLGGLCGALASSASTPPPDLSRFTTEAMEFTAHVRATSLPQSDEDGQWRQVQARIETISDGTTTWPGGFDARLTLHENGTVIPELGYGERFRFVARLRTPRNYGDSGAMDYRSYLWDQGIAALASVPATSIEVLPGRVGTALGAARARFRTNFLEHLMALAQEPCTRWTCMSRESVGVLAAMIIGEQSLLERSTKIDFQKTGAFHILVVSGMNVGIVAFVVFWLCRKLRAGQWTATVLTIVLALLYAALTDMGPPIVRAVLMLALYLIARMAYRDRYSLNSIGTAALILLVARPASLVDASFQLTFLAVAALGGIVQPVLERTLIPYQQALRGILLIGYDTALEPWQAQLRLDVRLLAAKLSLLTALPSAHLSRALAALIRSAFSLAELVLATAVMQVALALPMVWYFHRLAIVGVPVNIVVIPLTGILMPLGIGAALATYAWMPLARVLGMATSIVLHMITGTVTWLAELPRADFRVATPTVVTTVVCGGVFLLSLFAFKRSRPLAWAATAALAMAVLVLAWPHAPRARPQMAEITAIDVGQGDSLLVVDPEGHTLLIDGGGPPGFARANAFDVGEDVVSPYLWSRGIARINAVLLTHPHSDHMDGLRAVITNFHPRTLYIGAEQTHAEDALLATAARQGMDVQRLHRGQNVSFGALTLDVLAAGEDAQSAKVNDDSVVLRVTYRGSSALLLGDAERELEHAIAAQVRAVDLLKVAHHGSATSTTPELLASAHPKWAVVSVGTDNPYGHPRAEVLERLRQAGAIVYRTDIQGATTFYLSGKTVTAESYLPVTPILPARPDLRRAGSRDSPR